MSLDMQVAKNHVIVEGESSAALSVSAIERIFSS